MSAPDTELLARDIDELRKLRASRGWTLIGEAMQADAVSAAFAMADNPNMPDNELHFRRGAIYAARAHLRLLDVLIQTKENEALMASAEQAGAFTPDATA